MLEDFRLRGEEELIQGRAPILNDEPLPAGGKDDEETIQSVMHNTFGMHDTVTMRWTTMTRDEEEPQHRRRRQRLKRSCS